MRGFSMIIGACALFFGTPVTGLSFTGTPDRFVIGNTGTLTLTCSVTESDVSTVYDIKIKRAITLGSTTDENVAYLVNNTPTLSSLITNDRNFSVSGEINENTRKLQLSMDQSKLACSDARLYKCEVAYDSSQTGKITTVKQNLTLQAFVLPQMLPPLQAKRNGNFMKGGTLSDKASFDVGDVLELQCRANIGSVDSVTIRWRKTSEMDDSQFNGYQTEEGTYDEGSPLSDNQCGYTRTAMIKYNITAPVSGYDLAFECYVSVSGYPPSSLTPSGLYTTSNNLRYYIDVTSSVSNAGNAAICKDGYYSHGEYCYALLPLKASWAEALQYCKALGGTLAVIQNSDESKFIEGLLKREHNNISTSQIWIGGTDLLQEGQWVAPETLAPLTYFNWAPSEPDNLGGQHCLAIFNNNDLQWDDNLCEVHNYALCKSEGTTTGSEIIG